jgi:redox-sensitive bicupin YhaK (pirin superfamily)
VSGPVERWSGRESTVGDAVVRRALPRRGHRTVGAWCFADHMEGHGVDIGPHPHTGLQTVTWLLEGEVLHRDSLGSEQLIRPGQLNLMTAGHGVAHAEESPPGWSGRVHGVQLWVAQPTTPRDGPAAFEHHAELPVHEVGAAVATELVGPRSPARRDTDHLGLDLQLRPGRSTLPVEAVHEHALLVLEGRVTVGSESFVSDELAYLPPGRDELALDVDAPARALLLGGTPFPDTIQMWWNFVARTDAELTDAAAAWNAGAERFGAVASPLARIPAPAR